MYEAFFGFREKPFRLTPDPDYLYLSEGHADVLTHLEYALQENQGFVAITGEVGSGKTTLVHHLLRKVEQSLRVAVVNNAALPAEHFLRLVCDELEIPSTGLGPAETLSAFNRFLIEEFAGDRRVLLIVDEAQSLPDETLEEIRLLSNLQTEKHFLLQIVLLGQPQLRDRLRQKGLEQLRQRITVQYHLGALRPEEVELYIRHRLKVAGAKDADLFDREAIDAIRRFSAGIPRLINVACDAALIAAFAEGRKTVDRGLAQGVITAWEAGATLEPSASPPLQGRSEPWERLDLLEARQEATEGAVAKLDKRLTGALDQVRALLHRLKAARQQAEQRQAEQAQPEPKSLYARLRKLLRVQRSP